MSHYSVEMTELLSAMRRHIWLACAQVGSQLSPHVSLRLLAVFSEAADLLCPERFHEIAPTILIPVKPDEPKLIGLAIAALMFRADASPIAGGG